MERRAHVLAPKQRIYQMSIRMDVHLTQGPARPPILYVVVSRDPEQTEVAVTTHALNCSKNTHRTALSTTIEELYKS